MVSSIMKVSLFNPTFVLTNIYFHVEFCSLLCSEDTKVKGRKKSNLKNKDQIKE